MNKRKPYKKQEDRLLAQLSYPERRRQVQIRRQMACDDMLLVG